MDLATEPVIALDGGTTNTRARLIAGDAVIATARRAVGVRDSVRPDGVGSLLGAVREVLDEVTRLGGLDAHPTRIVAAGMLSSEVGLAAIPHVGAPSGLDDLARGADSRTIAGVSDRPIWFVPGVRTPPGPGPDGWAEADLMRGEEAETLGAWLVVRPIGPSAFLWPGSHTKLVAVDASGRIERSDTTLAGEILAAVAGHTLIRASLPVAWPDPPDPEALAAGARLSTREGLGRAAFLVRVADLAGRFDAEGRAAFWLGAVAADDVRHLARRPTLAGVPPRPVWVGGREPLRSIYAGLLADGHRAPVHALDPTVAERASDRGARAVLDHRLELDGGG